MRKVLIFLAILAIPILASAQAQQTTLFWDYDGVMLAEVQTFQQSVTVDGTPVSAAPTCVAAGAKTTCSVPVPQHTSGSRTYRIEATKNGVMRSTSSAIDPSQGPAQPGGLRLTVSVVVQVGG